MTLVIDASMALGWIFEREKRAEAECADRALQAALSAAMIVPPLWHSEVANALLVGERRKLVTEAQITDFLARLDRLPIATDDAPPATCRDRVMALGRQYGLSAYDASFLELTLRAGGVLATFDARLTGATRRAGGAIFE